MNERPLRGRSVAVPENRQLDVLAALLEKRGATVLRCPLVSIRDAGDRKAVIAWIERLIDLPPDLLILYTGEGVNRLVGFARRAGLDERFVAALAQTRKLTRGPKPRQALRGLGLAPDIEAPSPTTDGIIEALADVELDGARVGVQLYGQEPNEQLLAHLAERHADVDCVAPYTYASESDDGRVVSLIDRMQRGEIDAIAFTSKSQIDRLRRVAARHGLDEALAAGLQRARLAAVGPVVAAELEAAGHRIDAMPAESFHMKPLADALAALFAPNG